MYGQPVGARRSKLVYIALRFSDHQMNVKKLIRYLTQRLDNGKSKGNGWNKNPIHNVNMNIFRTCLIRFFYLFAKSCKIRCKNRGG